MRPKSDDPSDAAVVDCLLAVDEAEASTEALSDLADRQKARRLAATTSGPEAIGLAHCSPNIFASTDEMEILRLGAVGYSWLESVITGTRPLQK